MRPFSKTGRIRLSAMLLVVFAAAVGLASRSRLLGGVPVISEYGGDTCWAIAVYGLVRFIVPQCQIRHVVLIAIGLSVAVELSQLMDLGWLQNLRRNTLAVLVIGEGFLWSDLAAYVVGIGIVAMLDGMLRRYLVTAE